MLLASLDIKTAFDEARTEACGKKMDNHNAHEWLIAAFLRERSGLEIKAVHARIRGEQFRFQSMFAPGKRRSSPSVVKKWPHSSWPMLKKSG